jgi:ABC-type dipeptide/oligopeptide/nickel transport system ATPase component
VSYDVYPGETLGVVGESGSGKSVTVMSVLGLIPQPPGRIAAGEILLEGRDLLELDAKELRKVRGKDIAMIFQDPMTSLNPVLTVGDQIAEAITTHDPRSARTTSASGSSGCSSSSGSPTPTTATTATPTSTPAGCGSGP